MIPSAESKGLVIMRNFGFLACLVMGRVCAHPLCFFNDRPTDVDRQLEFCPPAQDGACCTEAEESAIQEKWNDIDFGENDECAELYKEVGVALSGKARPPGSPVCYRGPHIVLLLNIQDDL